MTNARRRNEPRCPICGRASGGELCKFHEEAAKRLAKHYEVWRARTAVSWEGYLREVSSNEMTGQWSRETAGYLLEKEVRGLRAQTA
jgi:hypothetical protein